MPQQPLAANQITKLLASEMIVRVAFYDQGYPYVIPLGYVQMESSLYGITPPGRKSQIAERNPCVGFQVDSSARTGPWEWKSVTGEGNFEFVQTTEEKQKALAALEPLIAQAPPWWQDEIRPLVAADIVKVWRIRPAHVGGVQYVSPEGV